MLFKKEMVESFEKMSLSISGMRSREEFEAVRNGSDVEILLYRGYLCSGEERKPCYRAVCDAESFISLLNDCGIMRWDGFSGKHPRGVKDGEMFSFEAFVNDGRRIRASGSENFPKGFRELRNGVWNILKEKGEELPDGNNWRVLR